MLKISEKQLDSIRSQLNTAQPEAVGYRLMVKPIPATEGLEGSEAAEFSTLSKIAADLGTTVATKTTNQEAKETHGSDVAIIVAIGPDAYKSGNLKGNDPWAGVGDVIIVQRYAGHRCEVPPGSGEFYQFIDDDDIRGKYTGIEL